MSPDHEQPATAPAATVEIDSRGIARMTICGGGPLNIIGSATASSIAAVLRELAKNQSVRVVLLAGTGQKTFVGGADVRELAKLQPASARTFISALHRLCEAARDLPMPSICAIPGWCIGVGLELAAACDLRVAAEGAQFVMPEVKLGIPSVIQAAFLSRLIGEGRARWMMLTGEAIDARKAESWGLVSEVVSLDKLRAAADRLATSLAGLSPTGMRAQKRVLRTSEAPHLDTAMQHSIEIFGASYESDDPATLMGEFLSRKRPTSD
jgi:enoyl-CoA hydratase